MEQGTGDLLWSPVASYGSVDLSDAALLRALLDVEVALVRAQVAVETVPPAAAATIAELATTASFGTGDLARQATASGNPVVPLVSALRSAVANVDAESADYVHRGATSQDIVDSALMVLARRVLGSVDDQLAQVATSLAALADQHRHTPMAGRTLGQQAVPITFGLKAAGWLAGVLDARDRVRATAASLPVQLGGAAGTLAAYETYAGSPGSGIRLAEHLAAALGLRAPEAPWHTRRTPMTDLGWTATVVTGSLGKIATDVLTLSRTEIGELSEGAGGGSSAMPHKANPVLSALIVSAARSVPAYAMVLGQSLLAEDERAAGGWQAEWSALRQVLQLTDGAASCATKLLDGVQVHHDRMRANLDLTHGSVISERLVAALAPVLGRGDAAALVGDLLSRVAAEHRPLAEIVRGTPALADTDVAAQLDPTDYLGAAEEIIDRVLARHREHG